MKSTLSRVIDVNRYIRLCIANIKQNRMRMQLHAVVAYVVP